MFSVVYVDRVRHFCAPISRVIARIKSFSSLKHSRPTTVVKESCSNPTNPILEHVSESTLRSQESFSAVYKSHLEIE